MSQASHSPDRVLLNGRVLTVDAAFSVVEAVAVSGGRVSAVGSTAAIRALAGPGTVVEDLAGLTVLPGLIDAHNHLLSTSQVLQQIQLYDCRSIDEILNRVTARVSTSEPGEWIVGKGWDESLLAERRYPTRWELDRAAPANPVILHRVWNKLVANSLAIAAAGVSRVTPDPEPGERYAGGFDRDESGEPDGLFRDRAKDLVLRALPPPSPGSLKAALAGGCRAYNAVGLVGVAEPGLYDDGLAAFYGLHDAGRLTVRTNLLLAGWGYGAAERESSLKDWILDVRSRRHPEDDLLRIDGVKFMLDGGIGERTARMDAPYQDEPDNIGQWVVDPGLYPTLVRWVHDIGYSIDTHTCGVAAQDLAVHAYAAALEGAPNPALHHRVHHAYFPSAAVLPMMARFHIPALVSTPFIVHLGESFVVSVGEDRAARAIPMASYVRAGVPIAGTSDSPIADFNPFVGMYAAVARRTVAGRRLDPAERIDRRDALRCYTSWAATATGDGGERGTIEPGKLADLVVVDRDPLSVSNVELRDTRVLRTMLGGTWVWERPNRAA